MAAAVSAFSSLHGKPRPVMLPDGDILVSPPRLLAHLKAKADQMYPGHHCRVESASDARRVLCQSQKFDPVSESEREAVVMLSEWVGKSHDVDIATRNSYRRKIRPQARRPKTQSLSVSLSVERPPEVSSTSLTASLKASTDLARLRRSSLRNEAMTFAEKVRAEEEALKQCAENCVAEIADCERAILAVKAEVKTTREALAGAEAEHRQKIAALQNELSRIVVDKDTAQTDPQAFIRKAWVKEELCDFKETSESDISARQQAVSDVSLRLFALNSQLHSLRKSLSDNRRVLLDFYYKTLRQGTVSREKGVRWVVQAIWAMNEPVPVSTFPRFLDKASVQHVLEQAEREVELVAFQERYKEIRTHIHVRNKNPHPRLNDIFGRLKAASNTEVVRVPEVPYNFGEKTLRTSFHDVPPKRQPPPAEDLSSYREIIWVQENIERLERALADAGKREIERVSRLWEAKPLHRDVKLPTVLRALEGESS